MKKSLLSALLIGCAVAASAWTDNFESGLSQWKIYSKATPVELIDDAIERGDIDFEKATRSAENYRGLVLITFTFSWDLIKMYL